MGPYEPSAPGQLSSRYDLALSFAGEDRPAVERFATLLRRKGIRVFYDGWEQANLLGKDLFQHLDFIYREASRHCAVFVSSAYVERVWTQHELKSAQARALAEPEYILPIRLDDTVLPALRPTIAYIDIRHSGIAHAAEVVAEKLGLTGDAPVDLEELFRSADAEDRLEAVVRVGVYGLSKHLEQLVRILRSEIVPEVRRKAAQVIDSLGDRRAIQPLLEALSDRDFDVRSSAAWALVHLGPEVRPLVNEVLNSTNPRARDMAQMILVRLD